MENKRCVLYVEDNADDVKLMQWVWKRCKFEPELVVINNGEEAISRMLSESAVCEHGHLPQLILLDNQMPRVSGLDVLQRLRAEKRTKSIPVVLMSLSSTDDDLAEAYDLFVNSIVRKSVDVLEFMETIERVVRYWLYYNIQPPRPV